MSRSFRKLMDLYRQVGIIKSVKKLLYFMMAKIYVKNNDLVLVKNLNDEVENFEENKLQIYTITEDHLSMLKQFNAKYRNRENVIASGKYLKNNYHGFATSFNNEMIGYWWWVDNTIAPQITHPCICRFRLNLKEDEVYGFDYFIVPPYRGQGYAVKFLTMIYSQLKKKGYNRIWCYVDVKNRPARRLYEKNGYEVVKRVVSYEIFSLFLFQDNDVFIRNMRWNSRLPFDHRFLFSLKSKVDSTGT
ncbi:MAG: GNAT family N-acetyltransferase [Candidatus Brocadiaceae bacterium]|nr:GNAT family N-acetyltransferase [Candidatus Brocadiaceae bacterium]